MKGKSDLSQLAALLEHYFHEKEASAPSAVPGWLTALIPKSVTNNPEKIAGLIGKIARTGTNRADSAAEMIQLIYQHRANTHFKQRLKSLNTAILQEFSIDPQLHLNWKDVLYGANYHTAISAHWTELNVNFRSDVPINLGDGRQHRCQSSHPYAAAAMSTTFFSNSKDILQRNQQGIDATTTHIMDSCICAYRSAGNSLSCFFLAMADGLGGHTGDPAEDWRISRASYFASKQAIRLLATFTSPNELKQNIAQVIQQIDAEIRRKNSNSGGSTTLTCAAVYKQENQMRVIGFNIGDSMLVSWHPKTRTLKTLLPGRQLVQQMGQGPAYFPSNYNIETEVDIIDVTLPIDTLLIPFTDGLIDAFKTNTDFQLKGDKKYSIVSLDPGDIMSTLDKINDRSTMKECVDILMQEMIHRTETKRLELVARSQRATTQLSELENNTDERHALANEKKQISLDYDSAYNDFQAKILTQAEYVAKKTELDARKVLLQQRERAYNARFSELQSESVIRHGDDLGLMVIKF